MNLIYRFLPLAILLFILVSCVGKKKYLQMEYLQQEGLKRERQLQAQLDFASEQIEQLQARNETLNNTLGVLRKEKARLESDTSRLGERLRDMARRSRSTQDQLAAELEATSQQLAVKEALIDEIEQVLSRRDERLTAARKSLQDSLSNRPPEDVTIEMREGQLYLTLSDQLIFGGRSTNISNEGEEALGLIAGILNRYPDLAVTVLGHTSTDRPNRGYADNWDLSVRRAANVVRTLTEEYDLSPNQITAAGKGEYRPLVSNDSPPNKLKNRRLEIILTPRLETLYGILMDAGP